MKQFELEFYESAFPLKKNVNPWNTAEKILCSEFANRYNTCVKEHMVNGNVAFTFEKCSPLKVVAIDCYRLEEKYFLETANKELMEDYYLNMYIHKQLMTKEILIPKNKI